MRRHLEARAAALEARIPAGSEARQSVQVALTAHLAACGVAEPDAAAAMVLRHLSDYARGTVALPADVVNALMQLAP